MANEESRKLDDRPPDEVARALDEYPNDNHNDPDDMPSAAAAETARTVSAWRAAKCLLRLRDQINAKFPGRSKDSDGTIGDTAHCPGNSDHCPNINDNGIGVVTGMDVTHDPAHGLVAGDVADKLRLSHDPRIKYIISNGRIANFQALGGQPAFAWRPYTGSNPHEKHFHISVKPEKTGPGGYDTVTDWSF